MTELKKPMTVGDLKKLLRKLPNDMEIVADRYSDYVLVDELSLVEGVEQDGWVMRSHPTMPEGRAKSYLYLRGN